MDQLVGDRGVRRNTDTRDRQVGLIVGDILVGADHMIQQIHRVVRQRVGRLTRHERDGVLLKRPHVHAPVAPIGKQQVQTTACRAQVVAGAQFATSPLKRFLNDLIEVKVEVGYTGCGHLTKPRGFLGNALRLLHELLAGGFACSLGSGCGCVFLGGKTFDRSFWKIPFTRVRRSFTTFCPPLLGRPVF